jgi:hypothetical protein
MDENDPTVAIMTTLAQDTLLRRGRSSSGSTSGDDDDRQLPVVDEDAISFAAHAAAQAMSESDAAHNNAVAATNGNTAHNNVIPLVDELIHHTSLLSQQQQQQPVICRICGRGDEDGRPILRFLPVDHDMAAAKASPTVMSFSQDIALHIFCGKTASILPSVNQPELEILTKAGLKNKHGIGAEVNAALARTRCAILAQEGAKDKFFYLVREFEAHFGAIRHTRVSYMPGSLMGQDSESSSEVEYPTLSEVVHLAHQQIPFYDVEDQHQDQHHLQADTISALDHHDTSFDHHLQRHGLLPPSLQAYPIEKVVPKRAAAGHFQKPELTEDGKVKCGCGGKHLPTDSTRGIQSWRGHILTKRHQKWMEQHGMLGAV